MSFPDSRCGLSVLLCAAFFAADVALAEDRAVPDWMLESKAAGWQARDSQGELAYRDRLWILGGWFNSSEAPPRDVWSSADGRTWNLVTKSAPWIHSDLPMSIVFKDRIWILGGWSKEKDNFGDVWLSADGKTWQQLETKTCWKSRHEHSAGWPTHA